MAVDQKFNIRFVQEVENYPCLYNYKLPEYMRKDVVEKAWNDIGKKMNMTGPECKEKWRNLRNVYVRNMKPGKSGAGAKKKKPYYLNEVMQFTLPFINLSTKSVSGNLVSPPINETNQPDVYDDITDDEDGSQSILANFNNPRTSINQISTEHEPIPSPQSPTVPTPSPQSRPLPTPSPHLSTASVPTPSPASLTSNLSSTKKSRKTKNSVDVDGCIVDYLKAKQAKTETAEHFAQNPKRMFLLSLLPDVEPMSDSQMRKFKRGVMQLIDEILEDTPTTPASVADSNITYYYETVGQNLTTPVDNNVM